MAPANGSFCFCLRYYLFGAGAENVFPTSGLISARGIIFAAHRHRRVFYLHIWESVGTVDLSPVVESAISPVRSLIG